VNFESKESAVLYTNDALRDVLQNESGTVKLYIEEEEKDLLSLTSVLYSVPDPILVVNSLLHVLFSNEASNKILSVTNASFLPNATQLLPELPVDFPKHPHIKTIFVTPHGVVPVDVSVTSHKGSCFMLIIRPIGYASSALVTESFKKQIGQRSPSVVEAIVDNGPAMLEEISSLDSIMDNVEEADKTDGSEIRQYSTRCDSLSSSTDRTDKTDKEVLPQNIKEGDRSKLKRTLDQVLFAPNLQMISMFLSSYKMFHTKDTILEELFVVAEYYFNPKTLEKTKETELFANLNENFTALLDSWVDMYPMDFNSSSFRDAFISLLGKFPERSRTNGIKLKLIKAAKTKLSQVSLIEQFTVGLISHTSSQDIANALTAKDTILFKRIQASEFYKCAWMKPEKYQLSPNLLALSTSFDTLTNWISECILVPGVKKRASRIKKFINIAQRLLRVNNFHTMMAIVSGLDVVHVNRLKRTWAEVPQQSKNILNEMRTLMDSSNNFSQYRKALNIVIGTPDMFGLPYMPVVLRDMTYTYESISNDCTLDNIEIIGKQLSTIFALQNRGLTGEDFTVKDSLLHFFATIDPQTDEEQLYALSLKLEPLLSSSSSAVSRFSSR
jgi:hypothetical protein